MTIRTSEKTVIFERPFFFGGSDDALPAGAYSVETDSPADTNAETAPEIDGQPKENGIDAQLFLDLAPALEGVTWDPVVRLIMRRDGLSEEAVWDMIKPVQALLAVQSGPKTVQGAEASHQEAVDRQVMELPTMRGR